MGLFIFGHGMSLKINVEKTQEYTPKAGFYPGSLGFPQG
jgi:hypothetical protein